MTKRIFTKILILVLLSFNIFSQSNEYRCHQVEQTEKALEELSPEEREDYLKARETQEAFIENWVEENFESIKNENNSKTIDYTIPVVFHIIHDGGPENISNEQVEDCIRVLNEDYQLNNSDASNASPNFIGIQGNGKIQFVLAKRDPQGNCTNGITRTQSSVTDDGGGQARISAVQSEHGVWPGDQYMNVFVALSVGDGVGGYTTLPGFNGMANGIHVRQNLVGSIGTASSNTSRTMTHEVGHWLDLPHTWGNSNQPGIQSNCTIDDGVADTPNTIGWTSCNVNGESCGSLDNVENYMEYAFCAKMFTEGQVARMHAALNSPTGGRSNVVSTSNLNATGVFDPDVLCKADFQVDKHVICTGGTVEFEDLSFHEPTGWEWSFQGGTPATSNDQNPSVTYNTPGTYEVTLEVTDGTATETETRTAFIEVLDFGASIPFMEGFESYDNIVSSPWTTKTDGNQSGFEITDEAAHTGEQSVLIENFGRPSGEKSELISQPIDLSSVDGEVTLTYRYAYRKRSQSNSPTLRVFVTNTCGENWALRNQIPSHQITQETASSYWLPESQNDWTTIHITNITSGFWIDNFRARFEFTSGGGNNFLIDDINVYPFGPSELSTNQEPDNMNELKLYPNPATTEATLEYTVNNPEETKIYIIDVLGNVVQRHNIQSKSGKNVVQFNTSDLSTGVYMVKVNDGGKNRTKRLILK